LRQQHHVPLQLPFRLALLTMSDPLSTAASIVALLEACGAVIKYLREVKDGASERIRLIAEMISTKAILQALSETVKEAESSPQSWSTTIRSLNVEGGPLRVLEQELSFLHKKLEKATSEGKMGSIKTSLMWPFKKSEVESLIRLMDRQRQLLTLALENDHIALSKEIQNEIQNIRLDVNGIRNDIADMNTTIYSQQSDRERQAILSWLASIDYAPQHNDFLSRREEGTGLWLLDSDVFRDWVDKDSAILFCPGIPGAGKTIMSAIVVEHLQQTFQNDPTVKVAYIYCNFRLRSQQTPVELLSGLLQQLVQVQPSLPESLVNLYNSHRTKRTRPSLQDISRELLSATNEFSKTYIIIDALDECDTSDGNQQKFLSELLDLQGRAQVSLFATSRPIPEIEEKFKEKSCESLEIRASQNDVEKYISSHMQNLPSFVMNKPDLQREIQSAIVNAVNGMYEYLFHRDPNRLIESI
jgi:Cdc6-like AAA superfamily ATPase